MKKKFFIILIAISVFSFGIISVSAATDGKYTYLISDNKVTITDFDNFIQGEIVIPSTIEGYPVVCIGKEAFSNCEITSVVIPDSITTISDGAFLNCRNMVSVYIPDSVNYIGSGAFSFCNNLTKLIISSISSWSDADLANEESHPFYCSGKGTLYYNGEIVENLIIPSDVESVKAYTFQNCTSIKSVTVSEGVKSIRNSAFSRCINLLNIELPSSIESILDGAFFNCYSLENLFLPNGLKQIGNQVFFGCGSIDNISMPSSVKTIGKYAFFATGLKIVYKPTTATWNYDFGETVEIKEYNNIITYIFVNGTKIREYVLNWRYVKLLTPPEGTTYSYIYNGQEWSGDYIIGDMIIEVIEHKKQCIYQFVDGERIVITRSVDYGTVIVQPEPPAKQEPYIFDYWQGYSEGMTITEDIIFTAVYKYKAYTITAEGLTDVITVTYNDDFSINPQAKDGYSFIGYFNEKDGEGAQITNEKGESLSTYNVVGDLKVYPYFYSNYMNKVELQCVETAMPGDTITQSAIFATDKNATYFITTVKYPKYLNFKSIRGIDFKEANKDSEKVVGDDKYLSIICVFDYEGNFTEINTNYIPFEIEFDVATDILEDELNIEYEISTENVVLIGDATFEINDIKNHTLTILPKLTESIEIIGSAEIDKATQYTTAVTPDYTTDKSIVWSINDETVATITQDGTVSPVKNGTVVITATAKDGSEVFATKTVDVIAYAKINSLDFGSGVVLAEFNPDMRKYTVYVKENATSISLTPTFSGGVLRPNGSGIWVSGRSMNFDFNDAEATITLNRENVTDMTNSIYTIEVIKFEGTKTEVSEDKKSFTITPINVENGKIVILALYNGEQFVEMQSAVYTGESIPFTTTKTYIKAKVMVWDNFTNLKPVYDVEIVK